MKLQPIIPKTLTGVLALAILALSVSCIYPGYWRGGGGWHGGGHYHRW